MVLEAVAAFGLAANVLQFVEFATQLIQKAKELSRDGSTTEMFEIQEVTKDLRAYSKKFSEDAIKLEQASGAQMPQNYPPNATSLSIARECQKVTEELLDKLKYLEKTNLQGQRVKSIVHAIKMCWRSKEIADLERRLERLRAPLVMNSQISIAKQMELVLSYLRKIEKHLGPTGSLETYAVRTLCEIEKSKELESLLEAVRLHMMRIALSPSTRDTSTLQQAMQVLSIDGTRLHEATCELLTRKRILDSLRFKTMSERHERISSAYNQTFQWIFEHNTDQKFSDWLVTEEQMFWISGKPGSGKSTLMKFIQNHPTTLKRLRLWAGNDRLVIACYYFWYAGTELQKSILGLLRSLLYKILSQLPELIPIIVPERWSDVQRSTLGDCLLGEWELSELKAAIGSIARRDHGSTRTKFCFFIDGLDEYNGDTHDILETLRELMALTNTHIKFCLSSRPWPQFEKALGKSSRSKLYVEDLTRDDIRHYVYDQLLKPVTTMRGSHSPMNVSHLLENIVSKAQGVFLWVYLVVHSIKRGIPNGDSFAFLQQRVDEFPSDLFNFCKHMFYSVEGIYRSEAAALFRMALAHHRSIPLVTYALYMDDGLDFLSFLKDTNDNSFAFCSPCIMNFFEQAKQRLFARCHGLLQIYSPSGLENNPTDIKYVTVPTGDSLPFFQRVGFLHRTVRDFLYDPSIDSMIKGILGSGFDAAPSLRKWLFASCLHPSQLEKVRLAEGIPTCACRDTWLPAYAIDLNEEEFGHAMLALLCADPENRELRNSTWGAGILSSLKIRVMDNPTEYLPKRSIDDVLLRIAIRSVLEKGFYTVSSSERFHDSSRITTPLFIRKLLQAMDITAFTSMWYELLGSDERYWSADSLEVIEIFLAAGAKPNTYNRGQPLLLKVLRPILKRDNPVPAKFVEQSILNILDAGADPNGSIDPDLGDTVWSFYIRELVDRFPTKHVRSSITGTRVLIQLIQHGADVDIVIPSNPSPQKSIETLGASTTLDLLSEIQSQFQHVEKKDDAIYEVLDDLSTTLATLRAREHNKLIHSRLVSPTPTTQPSWNHALPSPLARTPRSEWAHTPRSPWNRNRSVWNDIRQDEDSHDYRTQKRAWNDTQQHENSRDDRIDKRARLDVLEPWGSNKHFNPR